MVNPVIVDDRDPRIQYSGTWQIGGSPSELNGTTHGVRALRNAVVGNASFTFTGTSVGVFGTIAPADFFPNASVARFSVDGSDLVIFIPQKPSRSLFRQPFYQSPNLNDGNHTLLITIFALNSAMWMDYVQYMPTINNPPPTSNTGAIIGAAIGGVLVFLAVLFLLYRRRKRTTRQGLQDESSSRMDFWSRPEPIASSIMTPFTGPVPPVRTVATAELPTPTSLGRFHLHDFRIHGSGYVTRGGTSSEKTGLHLPAPSPSISNLTNVNDRAYNQSDSFILSPGPSDTTSHSHVHDELSPRTDSFIRSSYLAPPPSQFYRVESSYWPQDSPPSYRPSTPMNHGV